MLACGGHRNIPPAVAVFFVVDKGEALRTHCVGPPLLSGGVAWKEGITRPALVELQAYLAHHTHHCFHLLTAGQSLLLDVAECFGPQSRRTFVHQSSQHIRIQWVGFAPLQTELQFFWQARSSLSRPIHCVFCCQQSCHKLPAWCQPSRWMEARH